MVHRSRARRPRPVAFAVSLLVVVVVLTGLAVVARRGPIEKDLATRAQAAVRQTGVPRVTVTASGTAVVLHGPFASRAAADAALRAARVPGVSSARLGGDALVATRPARPVVLASAGGELTVSATVPDREERAALLGVLGDAASGPLTTRISLDPHAAAPDLPALEPLVTALTTVAGTHTLTVDGDRLVLTGTVDSDAARQSLGAAVLTATRSGGHADATLDNHLVVRVQAVAPGNPARGGDGPDLTADESAAALRAATAAGTVTFASGSTRLTGADRAYLDAVAVALRRGTLAVVVAGHTDSTGPRGYNEALSRRRAQVVVDYLTAAGVPAARMRAVGYGAQQPVADNATSRGRADNRRVEITTDGS